MDHERNEDQPLSQAWMDEMMAKRPTLVFRLFEAFLDDEPKRLEQVRAALAARDTERVRFLAHSMKGGAAALGADALRQCCLDLEMAAREDRLNEAGPLLQALALEMERVFDFMRRSLGRD